MAGIDCPTTTERNLHPDAEPLRRIQGTTLGIKRSSPEYQAGDLEDLRLLRKVLRGAVKMLMNAATEIRQAPHRLRWTCWRPSTSSYGKTPNSTN